MPGRQLHVDPDIARAQTLPGWCYTDPGVFDHLAGTLFRRAWHLVSDTETVRTPRAIEPLTLLPGCLDEPLVITRDDADALHCLSNVCTHRGARVAEHAARASCLTCPYHGRRFDLAGRFVSMPEFTDAQDFPRPEDDLPAVSVGAVDPFVFVALAPDDALDALAAPFLARCAHLPLDRARHDPSRSRDYLVNANWALYCENYLEGFHIPFVHPALGQAVDYASYTTEAFDHACLQLGLDKTGANRFDVPNSHPDAGKPVAAWYWFLFPCTMLNVYPWGVSVNAVQPITPDRTRIRFLAYVWDDALLDRGAGAELDRVEREDEHVVESVHAGLRSRLYTTGRFSPKREQGVHWFQQRLARAINGEG